MTETSWRDKYLDLLDRQERQEKNVANQMAQMQRALLRVSLAAEGLDYQLDKSLEALRHRLRQPGDFSRELGTVEEAVRDFDGRRSQRGEILHNGFLALTRQLQQLSVSRELNAALKNYEKGLKTRISHLQQYPNLLEELAQLQHQALTTLGETRPGFWQRFMGAGSKDPAANSAADPAPLPNEATPGVSNFTDPSEGPEASASGRSDQNPSTLEVAGEVIDVEFEESNALADNFSDALVSENTGLPEAVFQRPLHEPAFSKISDRVTRVLTEFLDQVEPLPCVAQKVENARERIERGLNWFELVPTLEDIRDLVLQAYLDVGRGYTEYLDRIHGELTTILETLGGAVAGEVQQRQASEALHRQVSEDVDYLKSAVSNADNLDILKSQVNEQLESIRSALASYQAAQPQDEAPLAEQLQVLVQRVQSMETEARQSRADIEEQRRKALQDALTGLPNREAYNERVYHEFQRWQRYGHPLSLAVCDIDFFKKINDTYGHQAGDRVLKVIAKALSQRLREVDFMARYGGEEFVILLPETDAATALKTLDKIRETLAATPFHFKEEPVQITLSIGVAEFSGEGVNGAETVEAVFERADQALYECKEQGRNQCRIGVPEAKGE